MCQEGVINFLDKKKDQWFSTGEIARNIGVNEITAQVNLRKLRSWNRIEYRKMKDKCRHYFEYRAKI